MAQTGFTPIQLYYSSTTTNVPLAANLATGELAINITDGKLFYKDNAAAVQVIGWKTTPTSAGGTGLTSYTAGDTLYYASGTTLTKLAIGTAYQAFQVNAGATAPSWQPSSTSVLTAQGDLLYASSANTLARLAKNTSATRYLSNTGTTNNPAWAQIDLTNGVTGTLPTANGGTGITSLGTGVATWLGTPSSANLAAAVTDETGSGALVFGTTPTIATPFITGDTFTAYNATYASGIRTRHTYIGTIAASGSSTITGIPIYYRGFMKTDVVVVSYNNTQGSNQVGKAEMLAAYSNNTLISWGISTPTYNQSLGGNDYRVGGYFTITAAVNGNTVDIIITNTTGSAQTAVSVFFTDYISTN